MDRERQVKHSAATKHCADAAGELSPKTQDADVAELLRRYSKMAGGTEEVPAEGKKRGRTAKLAAVKKEVAKKSLAEPSKAAAEAAQGGNSHDEEEVRQPILSGTTASCIQRVHQRCTVEPTMKSQH